jgi:hypothetical protein
VIYLRKVVIIGREPKDWDGIDSCRLRFFSQFHGSERFVHGKHGPAEEANLLPSHNCSGSAA